MRLADYIVEYLAEHGLNTAYAVTGRGALFINDALAKTKQIRTIFPHHEQSAAFSACAAADLTNNLQAVFVSTGCASTNTLTGVLSAWQDSLPVIFISGQNILHETTHYTGQKIRTYGQQEADIIPIVSSITKYAHMVTESKTIAYHLQRAVYEATTGNPGPVWLDIPLDLQSSQVDPKKMKNYSPKLTKLFFSDTTFSHCLETLSNSKRPVFLIGSGVKASGYHTELEELSIKFNIPITYTHSAVDCIPLSFANTIGSVGSQGTSRSGAFAVQNADTVIVLGSRLNSLTTGPDFCKFAREANVFVIDLDKAPHEANQIAYKEVIHADIAEFIPAASTFLNEQCVFWGGWLKKCIDWKRDYACPTEFRSTDREVDLYEFAVALPDLMSDTGIFVCDSGFIDVIMPTNAPFKKGQRCIRPVSQGSMGYALPASVGVALSSDSAVYCVVGDGSIMFNLQELETIVRYNLNIKICVISNDMYAVIKRRQKKLFRNRIIGVDFESGLKPLDFKKIALAFGIEFFECCAKNYIEQISENSSSNGPQIYEIPGKVDQNYLEVHHAQTAQRKFVRRPLEDQKPFLPREEFLANMIVTPIDQ